MIHFRPGTSDERVLREVLERRSYRKPSISFDVERGEHWLDLGANIGAFALYCVSRGATAECYEPDPASYDLLVKNVPQFVCHQYAVTTSQDSHLHFFINSAARWGQQYTNHHRGCVSHSSGKFVPALFDVPNKYGSFLPDLGCKIDIEGSEGGLIDNGFLPQCSKLVVEYHLSHDSSLCNLRNRIQALRGRFKTVLVPTAVIKMLEDSHDDDVRVYLQKLRGYVWIVDPFIFCRV